MSGFTVPNASSFGVAIQSLDQAEPDSLDFSVLGNNKYGVFSGFDATYSSASNGLITLTSGEALINGEYAAISGSTLSLTVAASDPRFDLVVAEKSGALFVLTVVAGTTDATNPVFPTLLDTQMLLYALYRKSGETFGVTSSVDKRKFIGTIIRSGAAVPGNVGSSGDLYVRTAFSPATGQSSLYVKQGAFWENLAAYAGPGFDEPLNPFFLAGL
jgi:hypothetical protein